ncbi:uncharacterized protein LOC116853231 [Odontomachus brunneus]|uniref:uncharacterized protein LOC116853231 n=1 Tax=Odontomachus brunneus TaxID=486640 RepID=UPI0013F28238|nr:uncharacterized protein LOC116853231 [Odontomachus brunneus]
MMETWLDRKGWERIKGKLPKEYTWKVQEAKRRNRKGRACGGMLMGIRKGMEIEEEEGEEEEGRIKCVVRVGGRKWRIVGVYVNGDMDRKMEGVKGWMEEREGDRRTIIGGDFNARTGEEGGGEEVEENKGIEKGRKSKDKVVNKEGRKLIQVIEERGWQILNGNIRGDEVGDWTYTGGRGQTVIDYVLGDREVRSDIEKMETGDEIDSDHFPIIIWLKGETKKRGEKVRGKEVRKFKYLGYMVQGNGGQEGQIRDRRRKAAVAMREIWGIGKRMFGKE